METVPEETVFRIQGEPISMYTEQATVTRLGRPPSWRTTLAHGCSLFVAAHRWVGQVAKAGNGFREPLKAGSQVKRGKRSRSSGPAPHRHSRCSPKHVVVRFLVLNGLGHPSVHAGTARVWLHPAFPWYAVTGVRVSVFSRGAVLFFTVSVIYDHSTAVQKIVQKSITFNPIFDTLRRQVSVRGLVTYHNQPFKHSPRRTHTPSHPPRPHSPNPPNHQPPTPNHQLTATQPQPYSVQPLT